MSQTEVEELKRNGNSCMSEGKHIEAMLHYTQAIKLDKSNPLLYSNRSLSFLKLQQYYFARDDANSCIKLDCGWPKGYYRKGEAEYSAEHYKEALASYKTGLSIEPNDTGLQDAVMKATVKLKEQRSRDKRIPLIGTSIGILLGILLVVCDNYVAEKPLLTHAVLQVLALIASVVICYAISSAYRYLILMQRKSLLEEPPSLYPEPDDTSNTEQTEDISTKTARMRSYPKGRSAGASRQRYKQGKSF